MKSTIRIFSILLLALSGIAQNWVPELGNGRTAAFSGNRLGYKPLK
jgi:hypothetical protein